MGFEPGELFTGWSITDVNQDGNTWNTGSMGGHSGPWCAYMTSGAQQADDWLISKCISLESSKLYKLSYWYLTPGMFWPQDFQVSMGNSGEPSALTTLLDGYSSITNNTYQPSAVWFTVPAAGSYYFGWHCSSGPNSLDLVIDDISIMEINALDAGVTEALSPAEGCNLQSEEVTVKVRSYSSSVLAEIPVCYTVNGGTPVCDTVYGPIPVGNVFPFTFSVPADLSQAGNYQIRVYTMLAGDTLHNNDTVSFSVYNHVTPVLPYSMGFETFEDYSEWVIEDVNDDNYTWSVIPSGGHYGPGCARYSYSSWIPADDWIITKCLRLYAGRTYRLGFWYKIEDPAWPENLAVYIGSGASSSYLTNLIVDLPGQVNVGWLQSQTLFSVPSDGYYYIGWKCYSAALMFNLYLDDIYLEEIITGICQPFPETSLSVYPNPGNGIFLITDHNPDPGEKRVEVFDGKGILLQSRQFQTGSFEIFLGDEPSGIYLLRIVSQKETRTVRLVKY
ncbi:MAG: choice-of-anchor J domain-containing protein [Bacteroidetes bacterium]|nr:choice-of-anchor J domain-containing protein [Bacteroidota bacterium]